MKKKTKKEEASLNFSKEKFLKDLIDPHNKDQAEWIINNPVSKYKDLIEASWKKHPKHMSSHVRAVKYLAKIGLIILSPDGTVLFNKEFVPKNQKLPPKSFLKDV